MAATFFTIGHSNRSFDEFAALLADARIGRVVDVRRVPKSRANPQFGIDVLPGSLEGLGMAYEHAAALGGLRAKVRDEPPDLNAYWENESFHNYADYALSAQFRAGLEHLIAEGRRERCVVMCAEAVWWRCHRRIIADYLLVRGEAAFHIMGPGRLEPARLTPGAVVRSDGSIVYPRPVDRKLDGH